MGFLWSILSEMGRVLVDTLTSPSFLFLYLLLFGIVTWQYRRLQVMSDSLLKSRKNIYLRSALVSSLFGLLGGILGSVLLVFLGVDLGVIGIGQLWLLAILLMMIKPRFLCFAYAAGLLSISSLLFNYPVINIPQLMGLVAVLHLVESSLILLNGTFSPFPVYVKKRGQLRGGFNLQLFWPIPLIALMTAEFVDFFNPAGAIIMPDWWPLLHGYAQFTQNQTYTLLPVLAMLGYGEISTTQTPREATRKSSLHLFLFSLILLFLSVLASRYTFFLPIAAVFSPLGHEFVIWLGMRAENRAPIYVPPERGLMILDVLPGTPAHQAGLRSRDIILALNGEEINQYYVLQERLNRDGQKHFMEVERGTKVLNLPVPIPSDKDLGIIPVPDYDAPYYFSINEDNVFNAVKRIWRRFIK